MQRKSSHIKLGLKCLYDDVISAVDDFFWPMESKICHIDGKCVWIARGTKLKNNLHFMTFHKSIFISLRTFQSTFVMSQNIQWDLESSRKCSRKCTSVKYISCYTRSVTFTFRLKVFGKGMNLSYLLCYGLNNTTSLFGFYVISTFVGYLMTNPFLYKWTVLFQTI